MNESGLIEQEPHSGPLVDAYRRHSMELVRFCSVLVGPDDANDVLSSAMVRLLEREPGGVQDFRAYLYRAVVNQARNFKRAEARRRAREQRVPLDRRSADLPEPYPEVRAAIEELSVRQRAVVYLTYWEDLGDEAVGKHLGIGAGSVRRHLARARRHLRRALDDYRP